jgi:hypothetical protein
MSLHRVAYISLIAAVLALRLICAGAPVSASDRPQSADRAANPSAAEVAPSGQGSDAAPLITGRSVAVSMVQPGYKTGLSERRLHEGVGAAGFARR